MRKENSGVCSLPNEEDANVQKLSLGALMHWNPLISCCQETANPQMWVHLCPHSIKEVIWLSLHH